MGTGRFAGGSSMEMNLAQFGWCLFPNLLVSYPPIISSNPSITRASSSSDACAIFLPMRFTERVRIWLILTHDFLGRLRSWSSIVSGNPARWDWLVMATAMTVPDRSLNTLWLKTRTGRNPPCSLPMTGFKSAQRISPLNIAAILPTPMKALPRLRFAQRLDPASRIPGPTASYQGGSAYLQ
jgi:hypothetical protein